MSDKDLIISESATTALVNSAEIDMQIATAHKYPRSIKRFRDECLQLVTLTESVADGCVYALPRGDKTLEGPSARFAEVVANTWGNCRAGARVVAEDSEFITAQGVFHDLEKNAAITFEVKRRITDSRGRRYNSDMIAVTGNAASSIAFRNAVLKGVPKAFWADMYEAARKVIMGDVKTLANRRAEAIAYLQKYGIKVEQICARLGVAGVEDIGLDHLVTLRGIATAIKEGDVTPENAFDTGPAPVVTPQAKAKQSAPEQKPEATQSAPDQAQNNAPAGSVDMSDLSESQVQIIIDLQSAANVGDALLSQHYPRIDLANFNAARGWLREQV